jgi:hypothetical protein
MNDSPPERPAMSDDLDQAYAKAHALADAARGPSATVRVNVLAAAREIAAQAAARSDGAAGLTPVAPPVAVVGRGRSQAVNRSSWRLRAGAAFCAALLAGVAFWRIDAGRRVGADTQLASAAPDTPAVKPVPAPPLSVPASPADAAAMARTASPSPQAAAKPTARGKDLVVAQAGPPVRERARSLARDGAQGEERKATPAPAAVAAFAPLPGDAPASRLAPSARRLQPSLQAAADRGDVETLKTLLANPATAVDAPDAAGRTALLHAVLAQQADAVRVLIAAGADPGRADPAGLTPRAAALAGANPGIPPLLGTPP